MGNEIYDDLDELPAPPRVDIPDADLILLERAACAIGAVKFVEVEGEGYGNLHFADGTVSHAWNPLAFSDDAFSLMVKLRLEVYVGDQDTRVVNSVRKSASEHLGIDPIAAARRAITRAAGDAVA